MNAKVKLNKSFTYSTESEDAAKVGKTILMDVTKETLDKMVAAEYVTIVQFPYVPKSLDEESPIVPEHEKKGR